MFKFLATETALRNIIVIILILVASYLLDALVRSFIKVPKHLESRRSLTYVTVIRNAISVLIGLVTAYAVFLILGVPIAPLLTSAGIAGIAIGLGVRPLIEDLVAGLFLLTNASIGIGDYVSVVDTNVFNENIGINN